MAAIKGSHLNVSRYVASEINFSESSASPEPVYNLEFNPNATELPYRKTNPGSMGLPYPDKNPCTAGPPGVELWYADKNPCTPGPLRAELSHCKQVADSLSDPDGHAVVQCLQKCWEGARKEGNLVVVTACPVIYAQNQWPVY